MKFVKSRFLAGMLLTALVQSEAHADGGSGAMIPTGVTAEGGNIYISGKNLNPDKCALDTVAIVRAANTDEANRMMSLAVSAMLSRHKISMWFIGCAPVPWAPSAPQVVSVALSDG